MSYPVVLLAGGLGTRIREETESKPKPMIEIGGKPILWHLMMYFSCYGFKDFIICGGYKSNKIADYFVNYRAYNNDFSIDYSNNSTTFLKSNDLSIDWRVTVAHTGGTETGTGGRLLKVKNYIGNRPFICTYGDGLSDINLNKLIQNHESSKKIATVTAIHPISRYGILDIENDKVKSFHEKPKAEGWINGGFFVFQPEIFSYLSENCTLEEEPLKDIAGSGDLNAFFHEGFWFAMDTFREYEYLNRIWNEGKAPWRVWK